MAAARLQEERQEFGERTSNHRSELRLHVRDLDRSQLRLYRYRSRCNVNPTHWHLNIDFYEEIDKCIVFDIFLERKDDFIYPVSAKINISVKSNKGQSTDTENVIRVIRKETNSNISVQFPHEMTSSPDIELDVKITLAISGCCAETSGN